MVNIFYRILNNKEGKTLLGNFISLILIQGVNFLIPILVLPYIINIIGPENYGKFAFIYSIIFYFYYISQYGFGLSAVREVSSERDNPEEVNKIFNRVLQTKIFVFIICSFLLSIIAFNLTAVKGSLFLLFSTYLIVLGDLLNPTWLYQGMERMKFMTIVNVVSKLTYVLLVFLVIKVPGDYIYLGLLQALGFLISGILSIVIAMRIFNLKLLKISLTEIKNQLKGGFSSFVTLTVPMLYVNTSTFLLGMFGAPIQVAYFDVAYKISNGFVSLDQILTRVFYPFVNRRSDSFNLITSVLIAFGGAMTLICYLLSDWIVIYLFGDEMRGAIEVLHFLSLSPLLLSIRSAFGINYLLIKRKDKVYMRIALISSITAFLSGLFLINLYESIGAAFVVIMAQFLYSFSSMFIALKLIHKTIPKNI